MKNRKIISIFILILILSISSCTTEKNTTTTRTFHNVTAHFNVYFNGYESFDGGREKIKEKYEEN